MEAVTDTERSSGLLSAAMVAQRLGVTVHAVRAWTRSGKLRAVRLGRSVRYDPRTIDALLAAGGLGIPASRTLAPWMVGRAAKYLADVGGNLEIAYVALDMLEKRR